MRANLTAMSLFVFVGTGVCSAQTARQAAPVAKQADYAAVYCSGFVTDQKIPDSTRLISSEQSSHKIIYARGDLVHINRGVDKGVRVGDRFSVLRPQGDPSRAPWFKWQEKLSHAMGTIYVDAGQLKVVDVQPKVSVAEVVFSCNYMQRGDVVIPFQDRPAPVFKDAAVFDIFAPVSGKPVAMVVDTKDYQQTSGQGSSVYVNLGTKQGVKVGDYFRIFHYQGSLAEMAPQTKGYQDMIYGFGSSPSRYTWKDLPREVLGEGIVLNVSNNSSTVFITYSRSEIYPGDYVEIE